MQSNKTNGIERCIFLSVTVPTDDIVDFETPKCVLDRLHEVYMKKSESKQLMIEFQLKSLKYNHEDNPEIFFEKFERKINELKVAEGDTS